MSALATVGGTNMRVERYRQLAEETSWRAAQASTPELRTLYLQISTAWGKLARQLAAQLSSAV
jgi:hypothetical protein